MTRSPSGFGMVDLMALIALLLVVWLAATQQFAAYASKAAMPSPPTTFPPSTAEQAPSPPSGEAPAG